MKKLLPCIVIVMALLWQGSICADTFALDGANKMLGRPALAGDAKKILLTELENKQATLERLRIQKEELEQSAPKNMRAIQNYLTEVNNRLIERKEQLKESSSNESLLTIVSLLDELHDILKKQEQAWQQIISLVDQQVRLLTEYLVDIDSKKPRDGVSSSPHSFDDLQRIYKEVLGEDAVIGYLSEQLKNATTEFENRRRTSAATSAEERKRREERELRRAEWADKMAGGSPEEYDQASKLHEEVFDQRRRLYELESEESENKLGLIKLKIAVARHRFETLKKVLREMKPSVRVSEADVMSAREELNKKKQQASVLKRDYYHEIEKIENALQKKRVELEQLSKKFGIAIDQEIDTWQKEPKYTVEDFLSLIRLSSLNTIILALQSKKDYLKALIDFEDEIIRQDEIGVKVKESFYKIRYRKFLHEVELTQAIKEYDLLKTSLQASLSSYQEKRNAESHWLEQQKRAQDNIKQLTERVRSQKNSLFKNNDREYETCVVQLTDSAERIKQQIDSINKINAVYADNIAILSNTSRQVDFIMSELSSSTMWHRPEYAVSWEGLSNVISDVRIFDADVRSHLSRFSVERVTGTLKQLMADPYRVSIYVLKSFCILLFLLFIQANVLWAVTCLRAMLQSGRAPAIASILLFFGEFFLRYVVVIGIWLFVFLLLQWVHHTDHFFDIVFCLLSIPYLLYVTRSFISFLTKFNRDHGYLFITKEFQSRSVAILSVLLHATVIIFFLRQAFILAAYPHSELPTILLAINFIILQVAAILSLLSKERVLYFLPRRTVVWEWIYEQVDRYYYAFLIVLIAIIVMSNPYVGFGRLVLYMLRRVLYTTLLVLLLIWVHHIVKQSSAYLFFSVDDDEVARERFASAKTWYGLTVIFLFLLFTVVGLIFTAKIWGWPEQLVNINHLGDIKFWLQEPFLHAGKDAPISVWVILILISFITGGILISYAVNTFVLGRIFDILLVDSGVQDTISSIVYYCIFILAIFLGFSAVNLGSLVMYIMGALVLGIGWVIKDPISDFVAYFVILVQRPLKVGDLIKIDKEVTGVVRKITPRTVVIRKKNSMTIIIPNSFIINRPITNWNYIRGFIAHNDIVVTVPYWVDPSAVQKILHGVLAENQHILKSPKPIIRLDAFTPEGYQFMVRGFLNSNYTLDQWDIASDVRLSVVKTLKIHGIPIAVPARVIYHSTEREGSVAVPPVEERG